MDIEMNTTTDLEAKIKDAFNFNVKIDAAIASSIPVSRTANATVFLTNKRLLFCYIDSLTSLNYGDIKKILARMNLKVEKFIAPYADVSYFDRAARKNFDKIFPGRKSVTSDDLRFYKTLVPYKPALVQISEIAGGVIRQYDSTAVGKWRPSVKFSYRRIQTS